MSWESELYKSIEFNPIKEFRDTYLPYMNSKLYETLFITETKNLKHTCNIFNNLDNLTLNFGYAQIIISTDNNAWVIENINNTKLLYNYKFYKNKICHKCCYDNLLDSEEYKIYDIIKTDREEFRITYILLGTRIYGYITRI